jgi:hypothetical protein
MLITVDFTRERVLLRTREEAKASLSLVVEYFICHRVPLASPPFFCSVLQLFISPALFCFSFFLVSCCVCTGCSNGAVYSCVFVFVSEVVHKCVYAVGKGKGNKERRPCCIDVYFSFLPPPVMVLLLFLFLLSSLLRFFSPLSVVVVFSSLWVCMWLDWLARCARGACQ